MKSPPTLVEFFRPGETGLGIDEILPVLAALLEVLNVFFSDQALLFQRFRELVGAPVVVGALQRAGNGFGPLVAGIIARVFQVFPLFPPAAVVLFGKRVFYGSPDLQAFRDLAFKVSVHHGRDGVRSDHALVVNAPKAPDRQESRLLALHQN